MNQVFGSVPALAARGLIKRFGDVVAVDGIDLEVRPAECFGLLGPNGAGKTTTIEMLVGLTAPDGGQLSLFGQDFGVRSSRAQKERIGVQLQETQLADKLTLLEVTRLFRSFYTSRGIEPRSALMSVGLWEKRGARVHQLSGGQRQRLAVATALVGQPDLLFLDEPTTGLDPQARRGLWDVVQAYRERGGSVLLTTHYMEEAAVLCDRLAIMDAGRVIAEGTPSDLVQQLDASQVLVLRTGGDPSDERLAELPGVSSLTRRDEARVLSLSQPSEAIPAIVGYLASVQAPIQSLETHQASLEDVFLHLTGKALRDG